jgi:hypothetical protein
MNINNNDPIWFDEIEQTTETKNLKIYGGNSLSFRNVHTLCSVCIRITENVF